MAFRRTTEQEQAVLVGFAGYSIVLAYAAIWAGYVGMRGGTMPLLGQSAGGLGTGVRWMGQTIVAGAVPASAFIIAFFRDRN